jgi:hypothetical protein
MSTGLSNLNTSADFIYSEPLKDRQIRILALQSGSGEDRLTCQLRIVDIADANVAYEAISYVWGHHDTPEAMCCSVDGSERQVELPITQNAADALRAVRNSQDERLVWIDSICISQTSKVEKSAQVTMMDSIFVNATSVLVWLGDDTHDSSNAAKKLFRWWADWSRDASASHIHHKVHRQDEDRHCIWMGERDIHYTGDEVRILLDVFEFEWFWRLWCVQELVLARDVLVYWGSTDFGWKTFSDVAAHLSAWWPATIARSGLGGVHNVLMLEHFRSQVRRVPERRLPFSRLLSLTRLHGVTEHHDRVFSLLGLDRRIHDLPEGDVKSPGQLLKPDYSKTLEKIYLQLAEQLVTREGNLHLLSHVQHGAEVGTGPLPSWVPQWHINKHRLITQFDLASDRPVNVAPQHAQVKSTNDRGLHEDAQASGQTFRVLDDHTLEAEGSLLATISQTCADVAFTFESDAGWLLALRKWLQIVSTWLAQGLRQNQPDTSSEQLDDVAFRVFYRTLFGGHLRIKDVFNELRGELKAFRESLYSATFEAASFCPTTRRLVIEMCRSRTLFITTGGQLGIGPQSAQKGDSICLLYGAATPLLMRQHTQKSDRWLLVGETYVNGLVRDSDDYEAKEDFEALHITADSKTLVEFFGDSKTRRRIDLERELQARPRRNYMYNMYISLHHKSGKTYGHHLSQAFELTISIEERILKDFIESTASLSETRELVSRDIDLSNRVIFLIN